MINNMHKFLFPIKLVLFFVFAQLTILFTIIKSILLWELPKTIKYDSNGIWRVKTNIKK
jgi:hypothetical protein